MMGGPERPGKPVEPGLSDVDRSWSDLELDDSILVVERSSLAEGGSLAEGSVLAEGSILAEGASRAAPAKPASRFSAVDSSWTGPHGMANVAPAPPAPVTRGPSPAMPVSLAVAATGVESYAPARSARGTPHKFQPMSVTRPPVRAISEVEELEPELMSFDTDEMPEAEASPSSTVGHRARAATPAAHALAPVTGMIRHAADGAPIQITPRQVDHDATLIVRPLPDLPARHARRPSRRRWLIFGLVAATTAVVISCVVVVLSSPGKRGEPPVVAVTPAVPVAVVAPVEVERSSPIVKKIAPQPQPPRKVQATATKTTQPRSVVTKQPVVTADAKRMALRPTKVAAQRPAPAATSTAKPKPVVEPSKAVAATKPKPVVDPSKAAAASKPKPTAAAPVAAGRVAKNAPIAVKDGKQATKRAPDAKAATATPMKAPTGKPGQKSATK